MKIGGHVVHKFNPKMNGTISEITGNHARVSWFDGRSYLHPISMLIPADVPLSIPDATGNSSDEFDDEEGDPGVQEIGAEAVEEETDSEKSTEDEVIERD